LTLLAPAGSLEPGTTVALDARETHHGRVRRTAVGDRVRLVDGAGTEAEGVVASCGAEVVVEVATLRRVGRPAVTTVAVGAGDRDRFGWMVEKLTELGVTTVVPVITERSSTVATRLRPTHVERLQRRADTAIKQCGALWLPQILPPVTLREFVEAPGLAHEDGTRWAARHGAPFPVETIGNRPVSIAVGPEGGWTGEEETLLERHAFLAVGLSPNVLRFETAAVAAATLAAALRHA
jgi:16S rRNA (uracil1498-N3)-methyltransferase